MKAWIIIVLTLMFIAFTGYFLVLLALANRCNKNIRKAKKMRTKEEIELDKISKYSKVSIICPYNKDVIGELSGGTHIYYLKQMGWKEV